MVYYGYSYFSVFFIFIIFLLIFLILLLPNYKQRDVVPPLTSQNYGVKFPESYTSNTTDSNAVFQDLIIMDGESGSGGSALDFGGSGADEVPVDFVPEYKYKNSRITGYFVLYFVNSGVALTAKQGFLLRVVNKPLGFSEPGSKLNNYNNGWSSLTMLSSSNDGEVPYKVIVPFNIPSEAKHKLTVQIAPMHFTTSSLNPGDLELNSAYVYYY